MDIGDLALADLGPPFVRWKSTASSAWATWNPRYFGEGQAIGSADG
jgi:hypothetical protein